jgi:DNA polymerase-3 subunit chi
MGAAFFYHLTRTPLEATLPMLLDRALAQGWRVAVRGTDAGRMDWLDQKLWLGHDAGFLPHGLAGGPHDALQPVLLTTGLEAANEPECVMAIDGATLEPAEVENLARACVIFDGNDPAAVEAARGQWRALTQAGCAAEYWSQEDGKWRRKAESGKK